MCKWRETYSGIEGEEMIAAQRAECKKVKAELREARTGDRYSEIKRRPSSVVGVPVKSAIRLHPSAKEGNHLGTCVMCHCPGGVAFRAAAPWRNEGMLETHKALWRNSPIFVTCLPHASSEHTHLL